MPQYDLSRQYPPPSTASRRYRLTDGLGVNRCVIVRPSGWEPGAALTSCRSCQVHADRAGVTRATFYNHYSSPLELLIQVLLVDLEHAHRLEEERRAEGDYSAAQMLRLTTADVAEHIERFKALYQHAVRDPADGAVYEALVRHFADYALAFIARCTHPDLPDANHQVVAQFVAHGFAGAIKAWLSDDTLSKADLVDAAVASAPVWWS
jgi:AcrR family transcriptional regulator